MSQGKVHFVTKEGLEKLKAELDMLMNVRKKEIAQRLQEAISYGDLSENTEYEIAKSDQAMLEIRIVELQEEIKNAQIIDHKKKQTSQVEIGSTVKVQNITDKDPAEIYTIVGTTEADPNEQKISNESPIGGALLGKAVGEVVKIKVPAGLYEYKVLEIIS
jgi:transcription elongation factor GreA